MTLKYFWNGILFFGQMFLGSLVFAALGLWLMWPIILVTALNNSWWALGMAITIPTFFGIINIPFEKIAEAEREKASRENESKEEC